MSNFQPLGVVDRGSETQPQVVVNLNKLFQQDKGYQDLFIYCPVMLASAGDGELALNRQWVSIVLT